jgi:hypothetical protein
MFLVSEDLNGVTEVCHSFLRGEILASCDPAELNHTRNALEGFLLVCDKALSVYNQPGFAADEKVKLELEKQFAVLRSEIQPYMKKSAI